MKNNKYSIKTSSLSDASRTEQLSNPLIAAIRRFFFTLLLVMVLFSLSLIAVWVASSETQKAQSIVFVKQAIQGNIDFSILQQSIVLTLGNFEFPWQVKKQSVKEANDQEINKNNIIPQLNSISEKHTNLSSCGKTKSLNINKKIVYKWKNSRNQVNLSDRFPENKNYHDLTVFNFDSANFFFLKLDNRLSKLPPFTSDRMKRDVNQIYKILIKKVGVSQLNTITLKIKLFDDKQKFRDYKNKVAPSLGSAGGFYISRLNEASVYTGRNDKRMYSVTRHEATHAIVNGAFGRIPIWLNEGLAEYFERLSFKNGMTRIVEVSKTQLDTLSKSQLPSLTNYFNFNSKQWYSESRKKRHYALGWSLVYFLMSSDYHKQFLRYMLDHLAFHYCEPFSDIAYFNKHYSGGLKRFEQNWKKWMANPKQDHRY